MNHARLGTRRMPARQQGVALVVALVLLLVVTVIGLASMRGTSLQERMSANTYDRALAFQKSEAALRAAEAEITLATDVASLTDAEDCEAGQCRNPGSIAFDDGGAIWVDVGDDFMVNQARTEGTAQYYIQFMGVGPADGDLGLEDNADFGSYGNIYPPDNVAFYRITARSSDPAEAPDRSVVVLQSTVKRPF